MKIDIRRKALDHHRCGVDFLRASHVVRDALVGAGVSAGARELLLELRRVVGDVLTSAKTAKAGGLAATFSAKALARTTGCSRKTVNRQLDELQEVGAVEVLDKGPAGTRIWVAPEEELLKLLTKQREVKEHLHELYASETAPYSFTEVPGRQEMKALARRYRRRQHGDSMIRFDQEAAQPEPEEQAELPSDAEGLLVFLNDHIKMNMNTSAVSRRFQLSHMKQLVERRGPVAVRNAIRLLTADWEVLKKRLGADASKPTPNVLLNYWEQLESKVLKSRAHNIDAEDFVDGWPHSGDAIPAEDRVMFDSGTSDTSRKPAWVSEDPWEGIAPENRVTL